MVLSSSLSDCHPRILRNSYISQDYEVCSLLTAPKTLILSNFHSTVFLKANKCLNLALQSRAGDLERGAGAQ